MKTMRQHKSTKLSLELFDSKLLKETKILANEDCYDGLDGIDEEEDFAEEIPEISLVEFERTLN